MDVYQIDIEDRVVLSGGLNDQNADADGNPVINQGALDFPNANGYDRDQFSQMPLIPKPSVLLWY